MQGSFTAMVPTFLAPGISFVDDDFSTDQGGGGGFRMSQVYYIYCALYLYYDYLSPTSDHQALGPGGWGPLCYRTNCKETEALCLLLPLL